MVENLQEELIRANAARIAADGEVAHLRSEVHAMQVIPFGCWHAYAVGTLACSKPELLCLTASLSMQNAHHLLEMLLTVPVEWSSLP